MFATLREVSPSVQDSHVTPSETRPFDSDTEEENAKRAPKRQRGDEPGAVSSSTAVDLANRAQHLDHPVGNYAIEPY
jgi:hypothetical protein